MNNPQPRGYRKKSREELISAIQGCTSLSQLFALIQLEGITLQMHSQPGASNLAPRRLTPQDIIRNNDTPLERLKAEVLKAIGYKPPRWKPEDRSRILGAIDSTQTLSELFALIQREGICIQMHSQPGASNLTPRVLTQKEIEERDTPFERLKAEVRKAVAGQ
ncbi:MAG: hypothetical protein IIY42_06460 [Ruminococcus sp.]|uniref:hypothetical protein n=1 Tax=uncultured Ruminococcus sp. TaxID=165186 RepID=UPI002931D76D|nr:hypothetical protein [uncultured Ruminococcus sp.]MBQ1354478.1 hypothetical protein [Ruminococcus sp.]MBQ1587005.1 hypothetical protein [Ruminococcus sp.]MBQ1920900.1 hypothetical protein [Ruminococcus sp.]MBQ4171837.1 hypothetical protein [Ruminococcus sp.]MBQ5763766.1 hypothetical protein [Ruminococcus sp.]